ncbi:MAG TPA: acetyl-CoA C-acetyltransferase [Candidatus Dormibacteraeota bacterium]|nr:acetyl-CoA C-acetyltransferase [Candidatus Dormibacteraeota bacterium]
MSPTPDVVILGGARTPFGTFGGALRDVSGTELAVVAAKAALDRSHVAPAQIGHVIMGNVLQTTGDAIYFARHVGLKAGIPKEVPALTVNRLCGSGLQAILLGANEITLGNADFVLAGGGENMSLAPHVIRGARWGLSLGDQKLEDYLWVALVDSYNGLGMANTAENLGRKYGITREQADEFAYRSHMLASQARESCRLSEEIVPVEVKTKKGAAIVDKDEHIRPDTTLEKLATLQARFEKNGTVTAGNASGINDGAAALVLAGADAARRAGLTPIARIVSGGVCGVDPDIMGIGPAPSSRQALQRAGLKVSDMDLVEINEAFATQYLAVEKDLGLDRERTNVNGGAIALGHPLGASGARLALTLVTELGRRGKRYGLASLCIGGGQGIAAIFERI